MEYELIRLQKELKEQLEERDRLLEQINEGENNKDNTFAELQKARALNTEIDLKFQELQSRFQEHDPDLVE